MLFGGYSERGRPRTSRTPGSGPGTDAELDRTAPPPTPKPPGRQQGAMVYDSKRDQLLLCGGSGTGVTNDLWSWSPTTRNWTMLSGQRHAAGQRRELPDVLRPARDKLEIYINYYTYYDFDLATSTWKNRYDSKSPPPNAFPSRSYVEVTYDTDRSKMLFIAGYGLQPRDDARTTPTSGSGTRHERLH